MTRFVTKQLDAGSVRFDASTSIENLGKSPTQDIFAQTILAHAYTAGAHQNNIGYLCTHGGAAAVNAFIVGSAALTFNLNGNSSGTTAQPNRTSTGVVVLGTWQTYAGTWDGGLLGNGIHLYCATQGGGISFPLLTNVDSTSADGTGSPLAGAGNNLEIGNRTGGNRSWNGSIALIARWRRVLSLNELRQVQILGPQSVPTGLVLCWYNGVDYGPYAMKRVSSTALSKGLVPVQFCPPVYASLARSYRYGGQTAAADILFAQACL